MPELLIGGPPDRRPVPRRLRVLGLVALAAAVLAALVLFRVSGAPAPLDPSSSPSAAAAPAEPASPPSGPDVTCPTVGDVAVRAPATDRPAVALALPEKPAGRALDRRDTTAASGPWTAVVRRDDGSLGRHSAVITFPVSEPVDGAPVAVGEVTGWSRPGELSWPIAGARARIRGDVGRAVLAQLATATLVVNDRPVVQPPTGYWVTSVGPYRSPHVRELRYEGERLDTRLAGLVYTGVMTVGGFEDQLHVLSATDCGRVRGRPAVLSTVAGGNATLAWQVGPGLVGYVGYSGFELTTSRVTALHRLAARTRPVDERQWRATRPQVVDQRNDLG